MKEVKIGKFNLFSIILIVLLIIRLATQITLLVNSYGVSLWTSSIYAFFIVIYSFAIAGIILSKKWGSISVIVVALVDLAFALGIGGAIGIGAGLVDIILLFLVFMTYTKNIRHRKNSKDSKK
ncbi:MAG: hypothetical protein AABW91_01590 [Nanoarchaeota archaeon]